MLWVFSPSECESPEHLLILLVFCQLKVTDLCVPAGDPVPGVGAGAPAPEVEGPVGQAGMSIRQGDHSSSNFPQHAAGAFTRSLHTQTIHAGDSGEGQDARGGGPDVLSAPPV